MQEDAKAPPKMDGRICAFAGDAVPFVEFVRFPKNVIPRDARMKFWPKYTPKVRKGQPVVFVRGLQKHSKIYLPSSSISYAKGLVAEYLEFGSYGFEAIGGVVFFGDVARGFALVGFEVGVGAMAEKEGNQGGVVAGGGQQEGGEALLGGGVGIGSGREKTFTGFEAAFVGGVKEGGRTKVIRGIHIDVCLKQGFKCREVAVPSSVHERGEMGATLGFAVFGVGPRRDEVLDPFGVIGIYGIPKCRPATVVRQIGVGLMIEQGFDGVGFFVGNGIVQGGGVLSAPRIDVGAILQKCLDNHVHAFRGGTGEHGHAVRILPV